MIAIVDYGSGNVSAIATIYKKLRIPHIVTSNHAELASASRYILPGVGAFDRVMGDLTRLGLTEVLNEQVLHKGKPAMGICVGMQILASSSDEGNMPGLGWVPGRVRRIDQHSINSVPKLPHMGWNSIQRRGSDPILDGIDLQHGFYFLHSYYFAPEEEAHVLATVTYGTDMPCAVSRDNIRGVQFHPEKSHDNGVTLFRNFAEG
ncbi:imidazole glycerol phosphate synthase [Devosia limi DSM 17137]|uniref:Imidazole glycerol phosphate synthase subunit HisH n=1 Tax=Devosia limi DSM 17137 TaxID=1121477 RepID=A0A0F5LAH4_9HYPH|nr:imidazole glycerol phosphate synthase subunit HisH [Devosia limi]KKB79396.1 imidazole glycerol phosphate synthase [Devosia limi DSM 17137]SHF31697.1 glutamine amidotransferase [Devosia limi DSM 17137]